MLDYCVLIVCQILCCFVAPGAKNVHWKNGGFSSCNGATVMVQGESFNLTL